MPDSIAVRVSRGIAWLDAEQPGWERSIDLTELDVSSCTACVLGQVFAREADDEGWSGFEYALDVYESGEKLSYAHHYGFANGKVRGDDFDELTAEWVRRIKERFDSGCLSDETSS